MERRSVLTQMLSLGRLLMSLVTGFFSYHKETFYGSLSKINSADNRLVQLRKNLPVILNHLVCVTNFKIGNTVI